MHVCSQRLPLCGHECGHLQLRGVSGDTGTSMLIEDVACPVDKLGDMTQDLVDMFQKYGYKDASCFGHALEGNLHLVFSQVSPLASDQPRLCIVMALRV